MKMTWNNRQLELLKKLDFPFDVSSDLSGDQLSAIQHEAGGYLMEYGMEYDNEGQNYPNDIGKLCYSIIDGISDSEYS
jgi:hypothetical protein